MTGFSGPRMSVARDVQQKSDLMEDEEEEMKPASASKRVWLELEKNGAPVQSATVGETLTARLRSSVPGTLSGAKLTVVIANSREAARLRVRSDGEER